LPDLSLLPLLLDQSTACAKLDFGVLCRPALLFRRPKADGHDPDYTKVPPHVKRFFFCGQKSSIRTTVVAIA
jgi:hypothetical protein